MIGQHIFSRCLGGYYAESSTTADSTTVTIAASNFAQERIARNVAKECERISTLEDSRPVPSIVKGTYRGVLKIRRLNANLTIIGRSYRLHWQNNQDPWERTAGGEARDFTYSSNYILSGEDKDRILESPEYFLNVRNFEPYPSVMRRIDESRAMGKGGRIEASTEYSLFNAGSKNVTLDIFEKAGFDKRLFVDYFTNIIYRVAMQKYSGHETGRVLVVLPARFNPLWKDAGGNIFAEQVLAATIKLLPKCISGQLNACTGGLQNPDSNILRGYQLVFMEPGTSREWKKSESSVIDLEERFCFMPDGLDTTFAEFLWDYVQRYKENGPGAGTWLTDFEEQYTKLFGEERVDRWANTPEILHFILDLSAARKSGFNDVYERSRLLTELIRYCGDEWEDAAVDMTKMLLNMELNESCFSEELEEQIRKLLSAEYCPAGIREESVAWLYRGLLSGKAKEETADWLYARIKEKDTAVISELRKCNVQIREKAASHWLRNDSLLSLYRKISRDEGILPDSYVKQEMTEILFAWNDELQDQKEWEDNNKVLDIITEQLNDANVRESDRRQKIYNRLIDLLLFGGKEGRTHAGQLLDREIQNHPQIELLFSSFKDKLFSDEMINDKAPLREDVISYITLFAVGINVYFLLEEWRSFYKDVVETFADRRKETGFFADIHDGFLKQEKNAINDKLYARAIFESERINLECDSVKYHPSLEAMRSYSIGKLRENYMVSEAARLLYTRFLAVPERERISFLTDDATEDSQNRVLDYIDIFLMDIINPKRATTPEMDRKFLNLSKNKALYLREAAMLKLEDEEELRLLAGGYTTLVIHHMQSVARSEPSFADWVRVLRQETDAISVSGIGWPFLNYCGNALYQKVESFPDDKDGIDYDRLDINDICAVKHLQLDKLEGYKGAMINLLQEIVNIDSDTDHAQFMTIRKKIITKIRGEQKGCLKFLGIRRGKIQSTSVITGKTKDIVYNMALLEEQLALGIEGSRQLTPRSLERIYLSIYPDKEGRDISYLDKIVFALDLIRINDYNNESGVDDLYKSSQTDKYLFSRITGIALRFKDESTKFTALFEDIRVFNAYKALSSEKKGKFADNMQLFASSFSSAGRKEYDIKKKFSFKELVNRR